MANIQPDEHSDLVGGSTAARRIGCPASYQLEKQAPPDRGSVYAREGTALHALMAKVIAEELEPLDLLPYEHHEPEREGGDGGWTWTIDEVTWEELGEPALAAFDKFVADLEEEEGDQAAIWTEVRCGMPGIPGAFGTTDQLIRVGRYAIVWDWKFGSTLVPATDNAQLQFYARAAAEDYSEAFAGVERIGLAIMQPKVSDRPDVWWTDFGQLERFREELVRAIDLARQERPPEPRKGPWCQFATCKAVCPLWTQQALTLAQKLAAAGVRTNDGSPRVDVGQLIDELPALLDLADAATEWAAALRKAAHSHAEEGGEIEGWELVEKKSSGRNWAKTEDEVRKFFRNRGYKLDDYMPRALVTPPAAEKLLKLDGRELPEEMFEKKASSGSNLVRAGGSRAKFVPSRDKVEGIAAKLKGLLTGAS